MPSRSTRPSTACRAPSVAAAYASRTPKNLAQAAELVLSGPHFFTGNPMSKTPRTMCTQNSHYDVLDLTALPDDYLPRTNYVHLPVSRRSTGAAHHACRGWSLEKPRPGA